MSKDHLPSTWGPSFWKDWQRCNRYHYHRYAEGLDYPDPKPTDEAALSGGSEFHNLVEKRLKKEPLPAPRGELAKFPPDWKDFPLENARWLFDEYCKKYPVDEDELIGVEQTLSIDNDELMRKLGLLLPISAKYDTIVRLRRNGHIVSREHKTASRGGYFAKYRRDEQITQQIFVWNALHPDDPMYCVEIDEVNKAKNPHFRFRREELFRTQRQLDAFLSRKIAQQADYLDKCEKAVILEAEEIDPREAFPENTTQCYAFNKPCKFIELCEYGREAMSMYVQVGAVTEDDEEDN